MRYVSVALLVISFLAATLGFGVLEGVGALVCRAVFVAAFVGFMIVLGAARIRANPALD